MWSGHGASFVTLAGRPLFHDRGNRFHAVFTRIRNSTYLLTVRTTSKSQFRDLATVVAAAGVLCRDRTRGQPGTERRAAPKHPSSIKSDTVAGSVAAGTGRGIRHRLHRAAEHPGNSGKRHPGREAGPQSLKRPRRRSATEGAPSSSTNGVACAKPRFVYYRGLV